MPINEAWEETLTIDPGWLAAINFLATIWLTFTTGFTFTAHILFRIFSHWNAPKFMISIKTELYTQGWRKLVAGYGSCHTNIWDICYYLPYSATPIFEKFTNGCHTNIFGLLPPPLASTRLFIFIRTLKRRNLEVKH